MPEIDHHMQVEFSGNPPSVSVLMAVYNGAEWVAGAIDSILKQTFPDFEFLIIDDGSSDGTAAIVGQFNDSRIRFIQNRENIGLTKSLNKGLDLAAGRFIARMDADDISEPNRLEVQVRCMEGEPDIDVLGSLCTEIAADGSAIGITKAPEFDQSIRERLFWHNTLAHGSVMFRKKAVIDAGGYDEEFRYAQDYALWYKLAFRGVQFRILQAPLYRLRKHQGSISSKKQNEQLETRRRIAEKVKRQFVQSSAALVLSHNKVDQTLECLGKCRDMGIATFVLDNKSNPWSVNTLIRYCKRWPACNLTLSPENKGVSGGRNLLIQQAMGGGFNYFLFLDNDLIAPEHTLDVLFRYVFMFPDADAWKPRLFNVHEACYAGFYTLQNSGTVFERILIKDGPINVFSGGASLVRRSVFERNGLYDEAMFVGYEDYEFAIRFQLVQGRPLRVQPVQHLDFLHNHLPPLFKADYSSIKNRYSTAINQHSLDLLQKKHNIQLNETAAGYTAPQLAKFQQPESMINRLSRYIRFLDALYTGHRLRHLASEIRKHQSSIRTRLKGRPASAG